MHDTLKLIILTKGKKRGFNYHIVEIEYGNFTPLAMSPTAGGGISRRCDKLYFCLT